MKRALLNKRIGIFFTIIVILGLIIINRDSIALRGFNKLSPPPLIAHAGGAIYGF